MDWAARGLVDALTYGLDLRDASSKDVDRVVRNVLAQRAYPEPVASYAAAAAVLLNESGPITRDGEEEQQLRDFLRRVLESLERNRPWPKKSYAKVPALGRPDLLAAPVLAYIPERWRTVEARLGRRFDRLNPTTKALVLDLDGGTSVALTASVGPGTSAVDVRGLDVKPDELAQLVSRATGLSVHPAS